MTNKTCSISLKNQLEIATFPPTHKHNVRPRRVGGGDFAFDSACRTMLFGSVKNLPIIQFANTQVVGVFISGFEATGFFLKPFATCEVATITE